MSARDRHKLNKRLTILDVINEPRLFGQHFKSPTWAAWRSFLAALFALPAPDAAALQTFQRCTGRSHWPTQRAKEGWLVCGRRSGKSFVLSLCAVYLAAFFNWRPFLGIGERGVIVVVAADRKQSAIILRYIRALLKGSPLLASLIEAERAESIDLVNDLSIEVVTSSFRLTRGRAICAALLDELAFWSTDENSAEPDFEIINAIRPGMAQFGDHALLLAASSPYAKRGSLWTTYRQHFGKDADSILVWQAPTRVMNPTISQSFIDAEMQRDPASAQAEYLARFRDDIAAFVNREAVEACVAERLFERSPQPNTTYVGFVDPSGGSVDSAAGAIAHNEDGIAVLDCLREITAPHSPEAATAELAQMFKSYRVTKIVGDRFAGAWPVEQFRKHGISYEQSARPKSDLYRDTLPLINSRKVDLLDHQKLVAQLVGLERRTARSGKDSIDHGPGAHDDVANAVCGALVMAREAHRRRIRTFTLATRRPDGTWVPSIELDPSTGRPLDEAPLHIRVVKVREQDVPAARGP